MDRILIKGSGKSLLQFVAGLCLLLVLMVAGGCGKKEEAPVAAEGGAAAATVNNARGDGGEVMKSGTAQPMGGAQGANERVGSQAAGR